MVVRTRTNNDGDDSDPYEQTIPINCMFLFDWCPMQVHEYYDWNNSITEQSENV